MKQLWILWWPVTFDDTSNVKIPETTSLKCNKCEGFANTAVSTLEISSFPTPR